MATRFGAATTSQATAWLAPMKRRRWHSTLYRREMRRALKRSRRAGDVPYGRRTSALPADCRLQRSAHWAAPAAAVARWVCAGCGLEPGPIIRGAPCARPAPSAMEETMRFEEEFLVLERARVRRCERKTPAAALVEACAPGAPLARCHRPSTVRRACRVPQQAVMAARPGPDRGTIGRAIAPSLHASTTTAAGPAWWVPRPQLWWPSERRSPSWVSCATSWPSSSSSSA